MSSAGDVGAKEDLLIMGIWAMDDKALVNMVIQEMPLPARGAMSVTPCGRGGLSKRTPAAAANALGTRALFAPGGGGRGSSGGGDIADGFGHW